MAEQRVVFRAIANFAHVRREARKTKDELRDLHREQVEGGREVEDSDRRQQSGFTKTARALGQLSSAHRQNAAASRENASAARNLADAERQQKAAADNLVVTRQRLVTLESSGTASARQLAAAQRDHEAASRRLAQANEHLNVVTDTTAVRQRQLGNESRGAGRGILDLAGKLGTLRGGVRAVIGALSAMRIPFYLVGFQQLGAAAVGAAGALFSLASAIAPVIGLLGAIPGAAIGAASALGTIGLAFFGIGDAIKAGQAADKAGGATAARAGKQREQAAKRAADAQRNLARAHQDAARQIEQAERGVADALRSVADAERALARAQAQAREAQLDLNRARQEALEDLEDMRRAVQRAHLSEERAAIALEEAKERLAELNRAREDGARAAADLSGYTRDEIESMREAGVQFTETAEERRNLERERRKATLDVRDAELDLVEAQDRVGDSHRELSRQFSGGIETSDRVVAAREALANANEAVRDSERSLADAHRGVADAQRALADAHRQAAESIADAQRAVAEALESTGEAAAGASGGVDAFAQAMAKLSPAGRSFVRFVLNEVIPAFERLSREIQEVLLPRLETAGRRLLTLIPTITPGLKAMAAALGDIAIAGANMVTSGPWRADIQTLLQQAAGHMRTFGDVILLVVDGLRHVAIAAEPLLKALGEISLSLANQFQQWAQTGRESGRLAEFFTRVGEKVKQLVELFGNVIGILLNVGKAAREVGDDYLKRLIDWTGKWQERTKEGTSTFAKLKKFFEDTKPVIDEVVHLFKQVFKHFGQMIDRIKGETGSFPFVENLRYFADNVVPKFFEFLSKLDQGLIPSLLKLAEAGLEFFSTAASGTGQLTALVDTLTAILDAVNWLIKSVPGMQPFLNVLFTMSGILGGIALIIPGLTFGGLVKWLWDAAGGLLGLKGGADDAAGAVLRKKGAVDLARDALAFLKDKIETARLGVMLLKDKIVEIATKFGAWSTAIGLSDKALVALRWGGVALIIAGLYTLISDLKKAQDEHQTLTDSINRLGDAAGHAARGGLALLRGDMQTVKTEARGLKAALEDVFREMQNIGGWTGSAMRAVWPGLNVPIRQHGGPVRRRRPYLVGEAGVELFVPRMSGTIIPNMNLNFGLAGMGGGGDTIIHGGITVTVDGAKYDDPDALANAIRQAFERSVQAARQGRK